MMLRSLRCAHPLQLRAAACTGLPGTLFATVSASASAAQPEAAIVGGRVVCDSSELARAAARAFK